MSNSITELDRFRSDSFEPMSFRERGATVPFTTPLLLNARIRSASSGRGFEMVVANPSGGRGALILPWSSMPEICAPTLFDRHLWESLANTDDISPIGIRREARGAGPCRAQFSDFGKGCTAARPNRPAPYALHAA